MLLIDCVESLSTQTLIKILGHHPSYTLEMESGRELSFLLKEEYLLSLWEKMNESEKRVLVVFLTEVRNGFLPYSKISTMFNLPYDESIVGLTLLRQKGIIFTHRRYLGEVSFFIPNDLREALLRMLWQTRRAEMLVMEESELIFSPFYEDLWNLLQYISANPLQLTQKGLVHRRHISRLQSQILLCDQLFDFLPIIYEGSESYSKALAIFLDFALFYDLLGENGGHLRLREEEVEKWLSETEDWRMEQLLKYIKSRLVPFFRKEAILLFDLLELICKKQWLQETDLLSFLQFLHGDRHSAVRLEEISEMGLLQALNVIKTVKVNGENWLGRPRVIESNHTYAYLQSNLQLFVPISMPVKNRWQIAKMADLVKRDQMLIFEINKKSIRRAIEQDWNEERIFSFLSSICIDIPENVRTVMQSWIAECNKVKFVDVILLECKDERLAQEILDQPLFAPYLAGMLSGRHLVVQRNKVEEFRQKLEQAGYFPRKEMVKLGVNEDHSMITSLPILNLPIHIEPRVENIYPDWEDAFPGIRSIPKSWFGQLRPYHLSSLLDLIRKAIQFHLRLSFHLSNGEEAEYAIPVALDSIGGNPMLKVIRADGNREGREEWIDMKAIKEICVHLPYTL